MSVPKISIVSPSYNQAEFIERNILSVLDQHYPDVQHLVIDGGSNDGTVEVLKKYSHLEWVSERDRGQTHALNKGFRKATGEIVGWLNSDDTYAPNVFGKVAELFADPDVHVVCGDGFEIDEHDRNLRPMNSTRCAPEDLIRYWKWRYEFLQPAFFFRRSVFEKVGYLDEDLFYVMDYEFFIRLGLAYPFRHLPMHVANLRFYPQTKTGKNASKFVPGYVWEFHKVSKRFWGSPVTPKYWSYFISWIGAIIFSLVKNLFFVRGSKSRQFLIRKFS